MMVQIAQMIIRSVDLLLNWGVVCRTPMTPAIAAVLVSNVEIAELIHRQRSVMTVIQLTETGVAAPVSASTVETGQHRKVWVSSVMIRGCASMEMIAKHRIQMHARKYRLSVLLAEGRVKPKIQVKVLHPNVGQMEVARKRPLLVQRKFVMDATIAAKKKSVAMAS